MSILFASTRPRQSDRTRTFAAGLLVQKADRLPIGPNDADREYAATVLNADTDQYSTEDADWMMTEGRTVSRREWLALQTELATERFVDAMNAISDRLGYREPEEAEVSEIGSQLGHDASPAVDAPASILTPADIATLERMGQPLDNGPEWAWTDAMLDGCDADLAARDAAKKAARKPRAKSMRQIRRAAEKAAKAD